MGPKDMMAPAFWALGGAMTGLLPGPASAEIAFLGTVLVWLRTYVYSLSAEHCFRLRNNAISDELVRDCALSTHSVFRP